MNYLRFHSRKRRLSTRGCKFATSQNGMAVRCRTAVTLMREIRFSSSNRSETYSCMSRSVESAREPTIETVIPLALLEYCRSASRGICGEFRATPSAGSRILPNS
ncbi:hypothetical protein BABINDRAFT_144574 [Babjeviella inositovora NRRL Y-12698]|uniref:Uncharacterized protein n=1 Tax=Babjeviella inositovora NRRL Y-12698 TaxID=984486 RepID=A0A1E3QPH5_9ASCO|nr:uncharacterized protein BABINDRAFT_144574 [Babjeviella inositovora NRRL Y-12698]ODQ79550.1 hypothetical protein BABINDRAFT_144574 [Babjeviella inositovora NRRL Y-12698]